MTNNNKDNTKKGSAWIDFSEIPYVRELKERALYPFSKLNYLTGGMELGELTIIAGEVGAGKTTFVSQVVEQVIRDGDKMACLYGESTIEKQVQNTYRQMTPYMESNYTYVKYQKNGKMTNVGQYFVDKESEKRIKEKTRKKLFYYDTRRGMTMDAILDEIEIANKKGGIKYFLIDNMTQVETITENETREVKDSLEKVRRFIINNDVHIILLAHYRKTQEMSSIRRSLQEIMGTGASGQKAATVLNIIRLDAVDKNAKAYKQLKAICKADNYDLDEADSVVEVLKTRHNKLGFVPLKYYKVTNTYKEIERIKEDKTEEEDFKTPAILHAPAQSEMEEIFGFDDPFASADKK